MSRVVEEEIPFRHARKKGGFSFPEQITYKNSVVELLAQEADELPKVSLVYKETTGCTHIIRSMITVNNTTRDACNQNFYVNQCCRDCLCFPNNTSKPINKYYNISRANNCYLTFLSCYHGKNPQARMVVHS